MTACTCAVHTYNYVYSCLIKPICVCVFVYVCVCACVRVVESVDGTTYGSAYLPTVIVFTNYQKVFFFPKKSQIVCECAFCQ